MNPINDVITNIAKKASDKQITRQEDYKGDNGLLYCGLCNSAKQTHFMNSIVSCACKCDRERREQEEKAKKIAELRQDCFSTKELCKATFANDKGYNTDLTKTALNYVEHFDELRASGMGLLIYGSFGTGKSFAAYQIANALTDRLYRVKVAQFEELYREEQLHKNKNSFFEGLSLYSLVVLDDLGAEKKSTAMQSFVFTVIDTLYRSNTPFIITTNLSIDEIKRPQDEANKRIYERILERCPHPISAERAEGSIRKQLIRESFESYSKILGI